MRIDHIALYTNDLEGMKAFYEKYFSAVPGEMYHNPRTGLKTYFLSFSDGTRLEIMTRPGLEDAAADGYRLGYAHIAFSVGSAENVDNITAILKADGFTLVDGPRTTGDGYYESTVLDPDGNIIELTV